MAETAPLLPNVHTANPPDFRKEDEMNTTKHKITALYAGGYYRNKTHKELMEVAFIFVLKFH